jgi:diamine N-acetyltransferase
MIVLLKNNKSAKLRPLRADDAIQLFQYLNDLSLETRQKFGPHLFDRDTIENICCQPDHGEWRYIAENPDNNRIIAYAIIKKGYLLHDASRLSSYGFHLSEKSDCTFAPSAADPWQSSGLGSKLFEYILQDIRQEGFTRMILWGGVQSNNEKAVKFYLKYDFRISGEFEYKGKNFDMIKEI